MSTFSRINLASRALAAAQRSMEVTGQNIANVNTEGYTRQRVEQTESIPGVGSTWARKNVAGDGVEITGIARLADALTDAAARQDAATAAEQKATSEVWTRVEDILAEPGDTSLSAQLNTVHAAWNDLANAGTSNVGSARATVIARSQALVETANALSKQLSDQWFDQRSQLDTHVADVNATARSIADLNAAVMVAKSTGASPNELLDKRDRAVAHLAELTGARTVQGENGMVDVYVGNAAIVSGGDALTTTVTHASTLTGTKYDGERSAIAIGGVPTTPPAGTMKAALDAVNSTVPAVAKQIDAAVAQVAGTLNAIYNPGRPANAATDPLDFFLLPSDRRDVAARIAVNTAAVSTTTFTDSTPGTADRAVARAIADLPSTSGSPSLQWRSTVIDIASKSQAAQVRADLSAQVSLKSTGARDAVSGVSIDEEMTNLVAYQHAYSAAARVLTTIDQALDTLINRTGLVGR